jgi:hypothetical protein
MRWQPVTNIPENVSYIRNWHFFQSSTRVHMTTRPHFCVRFFVDISLWISSLRFLVPITVYHQPFVQPQHDHLTTKWNEPMTHSFQLLNSTRKWWPWSLRTIIVRCGMRTTSEASPSRTLPREQLRTRLRTVRKGRVWWRYSTETMLLVM